MVNKSYIPDDLFTWVDHYLNYCGFDHIFIYDNCTQCMNVTEAFKNNSRVTITSITDDYIKEHPQVVIFQDCMEANRANYDYIFFCDNDELLWYNQEKYSNINEFLQYLKDSNILHYSIPWRCISYNPRNRPYNRTRNFKDECLYILKNEEQSCMVKSFISPLIDSTFLNPHLLRQNENTNFEYYTQFGTDVDPLTAKSNFDFNACDLILYHYYMKSWEEWNIKLNSYRIDLGKSQTYKETYDSAYMDICNNAFNDYVIKLNPFNV